MPKIWRRGRYWKYLKYRNSICNYWKKINLTLFVHRMSFSERLLIIESFDVKWRKSWLIFYAKYCSSSTYPVFEYFKERWNTCFNFSSLCEMNIRNTNYVIGTWKAILCFKIFILSFQIAYHYVHKVSHRQMLTTLYVKKSHLMISPS